jgi:peptide/nickel transport system ATP-binding protein
VTQAAYSRQVVLEGVELEVRERECVALVGESGSGKTTIARCISGLHAEYAGEIQLGGSVLAPGARQRSTEQRRRIQYVFQNPYASLNPRQTVGQSIATPLRLFFDVTGAAARARIEELLGLVSMPAATAGRYPAQLSGGERQRVAIARALAAEPALLVCDEVTSALDVSVQAAIVSLLRRLQDETGTSLLFITHNLPLIRTIADRVLVMSAGRIVEQGPTEQLFVAPEAQYTRDLLAHTPTIRALSPT